jgi:hypothetical protein
MRRPWIRHFWLVLFLVFLMLVLGWALADRAAAHGSYTSTAAFLDAEVLGPHHSVIQGVDMVYVWRVYGIDVLDQIVILGAETSLGDPRLGGRLVQVNNFGCVRAFGDWKATKWGAWADGTVSIRGKQWLTWPSPDVGLAAWGRYIKTGSGGRYPALLDRNDWAGFANIYYGAGVPGLGAYTANLRAIERRYRALAHAYGFWAW